MSCQDGEEEAPLLTSSSSLSVSVATTPTTPAAASASSSQFSRTTTASVSTTPFTPTKEVEEEWETFCSRVNVSPPKRINKALSGVTAEADDILSQSSLRRTDGTRYSWKYLEPLQQAGMAFLINDGIVDCFPPDFPSKNDSVAYGVLGEDKVDANGELLIFGKAIWRDVLQFVRKNGDGVTSTSHWTEDPTASAFLQFTDSEPSATKSCTMFSLNPGIHPVLRFQAEYSMVCAFVVSSLLIHYHQVINHTALGAADSAEQTPTRRRLWSNMAPRPGKSSKPKTKLGLFRLKGLRRTSHDSGTLGSGQGSPPTLPPVAVCSEGDNEIETKAGDLTLNIGRYMRRTLTPQQKYDTIFNGMGFRFREVLGGLLKLSNPNIELEDLVQSISIRQDPDDLYQYVQTHLKYGALCARVQMYEGYEENTMCYKEQEGTMGFMQSFHYITIYGVARTVGHGGIVFQAQDSLSQEKPFKNISVELLKMMENCGYLYHIGHGQNIKMPDGSIFDKNPADIVTAGGAQLNNRDLSRHKDDQISQQEMRDEKERLEELEALVNPNFVPAWARHNENNDDSALQLDSAGSAEGTTVVTDDNAVAVGSEENIEVEYRTA